MDPVPILARLKYACSTLVLASHSLEKKLGSESDEKKCRDLLKNFTFKGDVFKDGGDISSMAIPQYEKTVDEMLK